MGGIKFWQLLSASVKHFFKKIQIFLGFPVLFFLVMAFLGGIGFVFGFSGIPGAGSEGALAVGGIGILAVLVMLVLGTVYNLALIRAALDQWKTGKPAFWASIGGGFQKLWQGILVSIRVGWYVVAWPLLIGVVAAILFTILGAANFGSILSSIDPEALESGAGLATLFAAFAGLGILGLLIGGVAFVAMFYIVINRSVKSMFSLYAFLENGSGATASLEKSISVVEGRWWNVFGYGVLGMIIMQLVQWPFAYVAENLSEAVGGALLMAVALGSGSIAVLFLSGLYLGLNKK